MSEETVEKPIFSGSRKVKTAKIKIESPPENVFPLLCPKREYDWLVNWDYSPVFSTTGYAEKDCVFATDLMPEGESVWIFTSHEPDKHIEIVRFTPKLVILHWSMDLSKKEDEKTEILMTWNVTGLSSEGNRYIEETLDLRFSLLMNRIEKSMNHYIKCGNKITPEILSQNQE